MKIQKTKRKRWDITKIYKDDTCCINHTFWCSSSSSKYIRSAACWQPTSSCSGSHSGYSKTTWRWLLHRHHDTPAKKEMIGNNKHKVLMNCNPTVADTYRQDIIFFSFFSLALKLLSTTSLLKTIWILSIL